MEETTKKITLWKITKWTLLAISALVYILTLSRIFVSCDADISDDVFLTLEEKKEFENYDIDYPVYHYQPSAWTNDDGTVQIKNIYYLEPIKELQLTFRYRISRYGKETPYTFKIRQVSEVDGEEFILEFNNIEERSQSRFDYKYLRLSCSGISVLDGETKEFVAQRVDEDGNVTYEPYTELVGGNKIYLDVYDKESGELLYTFSIAGRGISKARLRRNKCDVRIKD